MNDTQADPVTRFFELDAVRDVEAIVALFAEDGTVVDERQTYRGTAEIRAWQLGPASKYDYTTEVRGREEVEPQRHLVTARLTGNFPGGTVDLNWDFTLVGDRIDRLVIEP